MSKLIKLENAIKSKILFRTEDGVDIYENGTFWFIDNYHNNWHLKFWDCKIMSSINNDIYLFDKLKFSTRKAAQEYIYLNKPCLSINDIVKVYKTANQFPEDRPNAQGNLLLELVKSKLK